MIKVSISTAAQLMNKGPQFVRIALQRGLVPFGFAVKLNKDGERYDYYINPIQFASYMGLTEVELIDCIKAINKQKVMGEIQDAEPLFE